MRKIFLVFLCVVVIFMVTTTHGQSIVDSKKIVKVGIIDSIVSDKTLEYYNVKSTKRFISVGNEIEASHGNAILEIISKNTTRAEIYYAQVLNSNNVGQITSIVNAINWCIENEVDIINMSFATKNDNKLLKDAISYAISKNVLIISSCLNYSEDYSYPAMYSGVISVSDGDCKDAVIIVPKEEYVLNLPGLGYKTYKGTSYATAYITSLLIDNDLDKIKTMEQIKTKYNK